MMNIQILIKGNKYYTKIDFVSGCGEIVGLIYSNNKRAQRALGRSPEEKVKGNSGANYREPQGHNLNNFGRDLLMM